MNKPITRIILIAAIAVLVTACGKGTSNPLAAEKPSDVLTAYYKNIEQGNIMTAIDTAYSESFKESVKANGNQGLMQVQARALMEKIQSTVGLIILKLFVKTIQMERLILMIHGQARLLQSMSLCGTKPRIQEKPVNG